MLSAGSETVLISSGFDKIGSPWTSFRGNSAKVPASLQGFKKKFFFLACNGILLFVDPWCGHKPEDPRCDKCTSGSSFNKELFSLNSRWQRQKLDCIGWPQGTANEDSCTASTPAISYNFRGVGTKVKSNSTLFSFLPSHSVLCFFHQQIFILSSQNNLLVSTVLLG